VVRPTNPQANHQRSQANPTALTQHRGRSLGCIQGCAPSSRTTCRRVENRKVMLSCPDHTHDRKKEACITGAIVPRATDPRDHQIGTGSGAPSDRRLARSARSPFWLRAAGRIGAGHLREHGVAVRGRNLPGGAEREDPAHAIPACVRQFSCATGCFEHGAGSEAVIATIRKLARTGIQASAQRGSFVKLICRGRSPRASAADFRQLGARPS